MIKLMISTLASLCLLISFSVNAAGVERGQFTTAIIDREPVDSVTELDTSNSEIKYFTEIIDMQGQTITHQWVYDDEVVFEKSFEIGGPRWRVWTSKSLQPGWTGLWFVNTLDQERNKLLTQSFNYQ